MKSDPVGAEGLWARLQPGRLSSFTERVVYGSSVLRSASVPLGLALAVLI
jgi:hypothetical protein